MNINNAVVYCSNLTENGFNDWRLPSLDEFEYLRDELNLPVPSVTCWTKDFQITGAGRFIDYYKISTVRGVIGYDYNGQVLWNVGCVR